MQAEFPHEEELHEPRGDGDAEERHTEGHPSPQPYDGSQHDDRDVEGEPDLDGAHGCRWRLDQLAFLRLRHYQGVGGQLGDEDL